MREEDIKTVVRPCPVCKRYALKVLMNRYSKIVSVECALCGNKEKIA